MTTYTAIPSGDIDPDSPITTGLMTLLRDNPIAITEGASGAPNIQTAAIANDAVTAAKIPAGNVGQSEIGANAVGQSEVKTTYQEFHGTQYFVSTGGAYVTGHTLQYDNDGSNDSQLHRQSSNSGGSTSFAAGWYWNVFAAGSSWDACRLYYINASPPYDLGDGEIPLFVFASIKNATGEVVKLNLAIDAPWVYNGPTDCRVAKKAKVDGQLVTYRARRDMSGHSETRSQAIARGPAAYAAYLAAFRQAPVVYELIDQDLKNADKDIIPTPWVGQPVPADETVVLVDPVSPELWKIRADMDHDEAEPGRIIKEFMKIGNTPLNRAAPAGLMVAPITWKNSGGQP